MDLYRAGDYARSLKLQERVSSRRMRSKRGRALANESHLAYARQLLEKGTLQQSLKHLLQVDKDYSRYQEALETLEQVKARVADQQERERQIAEQKRVEDEKRRLVEIARQKQLAEQKRQRDAERRLAEAERRKAEEQARLAERERKRLEEIARRNDPLNKELEASIRTDGSQLIIGNLNAYDWLDVKIDLNPGIFTSGHYLKTPRIEAGAVYTVGLMQFADKKGKRFNPFQMKIRDVSITAKNPRGEFKTDIYGTGE